MRSHSPFRPHAAVVFLAAFIAMPTLAQSSSSAEPVSDFTVSANVSLVSQYRYRGLMQTNNKPAIQGGLYQSGHNRTVLGAGLWSHHGQVFPFVNEFIRRP